MASKECPRGLGFGWSRVAPLMRSVRDVPPPPTYLGLVSALGGMWLNRSRSGGFAPKWKEG